MSVRRSRKRRLKSLVLRKLKLLVSVKLHRQLHRCYLDEYRSDMGEFGTVEKLRVVAFQRRQARPNSIDIRRDAASIGFLALR